MSKEKRQFNDMKIVNEKKQKVCDETLNNLLCIDESLFVKLNIDNIENVCSENVIASNNQKVNHINNNNDFQKSKIDSKKKKLLSLSLKQTNNEMDDSNFGCDIMSQLWNYSQFIRDVDRAIEKSVDTQNSNIVDTITQKQNSSKLETKNYDIKENIKVSSNCSNTSNNISSNKNCIPSSNKVNRFNLNTIYDKENLTNNLDSEPDHNSKVSIDNIDKKNNDNNSSQLNNSLELFKPPNQYIEKNKNINIKTVIKEIKNNEYELDENLQISISKLFDSSEYRKTMETTFDNLQVSILTANDENKSNLSTKNIGDTINNMEWQEDFTISKSNLTNNIDVSQEITSYTTNILLKNAHNSINKYQDESYVEDNTELDFINLGPFYGLPLIVKQLIQHYKGIENLYDWQDECLKLDAIKNRKNLVYTLPTSGGKTLVSEILILREILCRKKNALFVLPYVSIVQEKMWTFSPFAVGLDFLLEEYAAGKGKYPPRKRRHKKSTYIATIEKALGLVNSLIETDRLDELGLVVVDELHLIGEVGRGATLETLLTKLIYYGNKIQIIGMTATIGNLPEICKFLKAEYFEKNFRPVELIEYIKCENTIAINKNHEIVPVRKVDCTYSEKQLKIDPDKIGVLVMEVIPEASCLIFCPTKKNCENVALLLTRVLKRDLLHYKKAEKEILMKTIQSEGTICDILRKTLPFGIAYHHSGLTMDERKIIEDGFRAGTLCVICCTSTLAAGVNLPAKRVILRSPYVGLEFINLSRYKQMIGRAGRAGYGEVGESILLCERRDLEKVINLLHAPMDEAFSSLVQNESKGLKSLILSSIVLGIATTRKKLQKVTVNTLLAVQQERMEVNIKKLTDEAITDLFKRGALQIGNDEVVDKNVSVLLQTTIDNNINHNEEKQQIVIRNDMRLTISKLGRAAIKGGMDLDKARILYEDLIQAQSSLVLLDCLHLLYLVTPYDLAEQIKPRMLKYYEVYTELGIKELQTASVLGITEACATCMMTGRPIKSVTQRVLNRFYLTLILHALWNGKTVFQVSNKFEVARGLVQQLMTNAATFASSVVHFCEELDEFWAFSDLLKGMTLRLQHCSSKELLPLMELPSVKISRAKQLYAAGYSTLQSIAKADPNELINNIEHLSRKVANQLIAAAKLSLLEKVENLREEAEDVLEGMTISV